MDYTGFNVNMMMMMMMMIMMTNGDIVDGRCNGPPVSACQ